MRRPVDREVARLEQERDGHGAAPVTPQWSWVRIQLMYMFCPLGVHRQFYNSADRA